MLLELHVTNIAVIKEARVGLAGSFNTFTGETGAGKSLLVDALLLLMGGGGAEMVRTGETAAAVEAVFAADDTLTSEFDEIEDGGEIVLRRSIQSGGKSRYAINGATTTQKRMRELLVRLVHLYGQSESKDLYSPAYQCDLFDLYAGTAPLLAELRNRIREGRSLRDEYDRLREQEAHRSRDLDFLAFQIDEIEAATLDDRDEEERLVAKRAMLQSREKIIAAVAAACDALHDGEGSAFERIGTATHALGTAGGSDAALADAERALRGIAEELRQQSYQLRDHAGSLDEADDDLDAIEDRLDVIRRMKKKYGPAIDDVQRHLDEARRSRAALAALDDNQAAVVKQLDAMRDAITATARRLSDARAAKAGGFAAAVRSELADLAMPGASFEVVLAPVAAATPEDIPGRGAETVEFLFSPNPGEDARPLARIASGGELSRAMLAIKNIIPREHPMTLVFDEVDTGVGGRTAEMIGRKLHEIARTHQVVCITHLPQVAVWADRHLLVEKRETGGRTEASVKLLDEGGRVAETARMLGSDGEGKGLDYAKEMLRRCRSAKR